MGYFLNAIEKLPLDDDSEVARLSEELAKELRKKIGSKRLPSFEEQMKRLKDL